LTRSSLAQRLQIAKTYKELFERDLVEMAKSKLKGKFEDAIVAMLQSPEVYDAHSLNKAMEGAGTNEDTLIEIIFSRSNEELTAIEKAYKDLYKKDLEKVIADETSGPFKKLLVSRLQDERQVAYAGWGWPSRGFTVDKPKAEADAKILVGHEPKKWATDDNILLNIFAKKSLAHLKVVFEEYKRLTGKEVNAVLKAELSGDIKTSLRSIVEFVENKNIFFAHRLHHSMKGLGTSDKKLTRIIITRSEKDLASIKEEFLKKYGKTLELMVKGETSGDYEELLLALLK